MIHLVTLYNCTCNDLAAQIHILFWLSSTYYIPPGPRATSHIPILILLLSKFSVWNYDYLMFLPVILLLGSSLYVQVHFWFEFKQACDSEEDGLFAFDLHSDGDGLRYAFESHWEVRTECEFFWSRSNILCTFLVFKATSLCTVRLPKTPPTAGLIHVVLTWLCFCKL